MSMGVIFDVDGVLVDSYAAHYESWATLAAELGQSFSHETFASTFGRTSRDIIIECFDGSGLSDEEISALDEQKEAIYRTLVSSSFPAMDGAVELIDELHRADIMLAVGSSGPPENVELVMEQLGRPHAFAARVTGRDVTRGKPDPQVFELAAERLGLDPTRCVVIEDAPAGVQAAHQAGSLCIGLASTGRTVQELHEAELIVHSLRHVSVDTIGQLLDDHAR